MCLILLALDVVPQKRWLVLGNRDELYARPAAAAQAWTDAPTIIGGRDLQAGGSWLAINRSGRFAAVTNVRSGSMQRGARSRGELVGNFVGGAASPQEYAKDVAIRRAQYGPFNLVVGDDETAYAASSLAENAWQLARGIHVLSNSPPGEEWPKARFLRTAFASCLHEGRLDDATLLDLLGNSTQPDEAELPHTGVTAELERFLAPIFIRGTEYGTRASTLAYLLDDDKLRLCERRFGPNGASLGESDINAGTTDQGPGTRG
jgi:uncharacterized protein with NRDE domain